MRSNLLLALVLGLTMQLPARLKLPAPAPEVHLKDLDGKPLDLASLRGKVVLVNFWATWCGPCREEAPHFKALQDRYRNQGLRVLGLSLDENTTPVEKFRREQALNYPIALADLTTTARFGGVLGLPTLFIVDRGGRIVAEHQAEMAPQTLVHDIEMALEAPTQ